MRNQPDKLVKGIRWKLGIPVDQDAKGAEDAWNYVFTQMRAELQCVSPRLGEMLRDAVTLKLGLPCHVKDTERQGLLELWQAVVQWMNASPVQRSALVARQIQRAIAPTAAAASRAQQARRRSSISTTSS